ncbi:MAG: type VI secretion system ATPase TssH [Candidatus Tenebribacter mawsonii]|nr:type VI secretion system ATPase TssH [Candidatus Tenebribacter mawsonii]
MAEIQRSVLFKKLNKIGYKSLENATVFCKMRRNPYVEFVHWLHQMMQNQNSDLHCIMNHYALNTSHIAGDIVKALEKLPTGSSSISDLSSRLDEIMENTWKFSSLFFNENQIRSGHIIYTILNTRYLANELLSISDEFKKVKINDLGENFFDITKTSPENISSQESSYTDEETKEQAGILPGQKLEALSKFSIDLTAKAAKGELDPVIGRENEIRQIVDILMRRRQNNPILVGEPGVGKSALVEGFAQKIINKEVPPCLHNVIVRVLDMGLLQAGASVKGEFEQRLKNVIKEVDNSSKPIILFIDEAHTLMGAGGNGNDAANILKPALARGTFKTIAATTWTEYKKYIEKDSALTRRFQIVKVPEPSVEDTTTILRGLANVMEKHHKVMILDEGLLAATNLSQRYLTDRKQPDKAISLLDTSAARVAISLHSKPAIVEDSQNRIKNYKNEIDILEREQRLGYNNKKFINEANEKLQEEKAILEKAEAKWMSEKNIVDKILEIRETLNNAGINTTLKEEDTQQQQNENDIDLKNIDEQTSCAELEEPQTAQDETINIEELTAEMKNYLDELVEIQGDDPLLLPCVDGNVVGAVVSDWTGIPAGKMVKNEISSILKLADTLEKRIIGQNHAMDAIAKRIKTSRAGFDNPSRPIGVFMLVGPSGVGKTETALALGEALYGGEQNIITINMSEFQESHTVSTLKGAPPGYVGYGEGGVLTEAVRRNPYSIVLLDEVEKAHSDVHKIFFQVFDKGMMEDGEGRRINFKNTIILLTSNVGTELIMDMCENTEKKPDPKDITEALKTDLLKVFPAALLGRLTIIPYYPISFEMLDVIIKLQLDRIKDRLKNNRGIELTYSKSVTDLIASRCNDADSGARMIDSILTHDILPPISTEYLNKLAEGISVAKIKIKVKNKEFAFDFILEEE